MPEVASSIVSMSATTPGLASTIEGRISPPPRLLVIKDGVATYLDHLRAKGFEVEVLPHGEKAVAALSVQRHQAIIVEQAKRPDAGWTLLQLIRAYLGWRDVPIVVIGRATEDGLAEQRWRAFKVARVFEPAGVAGAAVARCLQQLLGLPTPPFPQEPYIVPGSAVTLNPALALRFLPTVAAAAEPSPLHSGSRPGNP